MRSRLRPFERQIDVVLQEDGPEELKALIERGGPGLLAIEAQLDLGEQIIGQLQRLLSLLRAAAERQEVIRIAHQRLAEESKIFVELVQEQIGEHGEVTEPWGTPQVKG